MDPILTVLLLIILVLSNVLVITKKNKFRKYKKVIYILLFIVIVFLSFNIFKSSKKKEQFQRGGNTNYKNKKRKILLEKCGLPVSDYDAVNHCFNDGTHHTCCNLGNKSLNYAKKTRNNIKDPAIDAYITRNYNKVTPELRNQVKKKLEAGTLKIPWCTCSGSQVCSYYGKKYGDSNINFVNVPNSKAYIEDVPLDCEKAATSNKEILIHGTPGVGEQTQNCLKTLTTKKVLL